MGKNIMIEKWGITFEPHGNQVDFKWVVLDSDGRFLTNIPYDAELEDPKELENIDDFDEMLDKIHLGYNVDIEKVIKAEDYSQEKAEASGLDYYNRLNDIYLKLYE